MSSEKQTGSQEGKMQGLMLWTKSKVMNCVKRNQLFAQKIMKAFMMEIRWFQPSEKHGVASQ